MSRSLVAALLLTLAGCMQTVHGPAGPQAPGASATRGAAKPKLDYREYTTGVALSADFSRLDDWDSPDPEHVVLWSTPNRAYLLTLFGPCYELNGAPTIALTGRSFVRADADAVLVRGERCRIQRIEQLDTRRLKEAQAQAK